MSIAAEFVQNNDIWISVILVLISLLSTVFNISTIKIKNKSDYEVRTELMFAVVFTGISVFLWCMFLLLINYEM